MFSRLIASATGVPRQSTGARLLERMTNATQIDDRREAISDFKELSATEPIRLVDKGGMAVLVGLLAEEDTRITRDTLESLSNLVDPDVPRSGDGGGGEGDHEGEAQRRRLPDERDVPDGGDAQLAG